MKPPMTPAGCESPSLAKAADGAGPVYEVKFLLDAGAAREVERWAQGRLMLDPHNDPALDGAYHTASLYCDTPELDAYHRSPSYKRRKFRVRRYGTSPQVFLERKSKSGDRVSKRRVALLDDELTHLTQMMSAVAWPGHPVTGSTAACSCDAFSPHVLPRTSAPRLSAPAPSARCA